MKMMLRAMSFGTVRLHWLFAGIIFAWAVIYILSMITPLAIRELFTIIANSANYGYAFFGTALWIIVGVLITVYVVRAILSFVAHYYGHKYSDRIFKSLRHALYQHLQTLSPKFYNDKQIGKIVKTMMDDTYKLDEFLAHSIPDAIIAIVTLIGVSIILFILNPILAVLVLAPVPILFFIALLRRRANRHYTATRQKMAEAYGMLSDNLQGMKEIQVFGKHDHEAQKLRAKDNEASMHVFRGLRWNCMIRPAMEMIQAVSMILVIVVGGYFATQGNVDVADIIAVAMFVGLLYGPILNAARVFEVASDVIPGLRGVFAFLDTKSTVVDGGTMEIERVRGDIEFKNVTFGYNDNRVLDNISFTAPSGSMIALVGETGAGKTTIAQLLARFYDINDGTISIDGTPITDLTLANLRSHISIVLQDVFLFNGTIGENIAYGCPTGSVTKDKIVEVSKSACIHDFIEGLSNKYDTLIGERGVRLSGGQKQRLAIARALLRNSPILILDEATSSIDNTTEKEIQKAIDKLSQNKTQTLIVIAHRLSTIEKADKILFLQDGKVVEQGTHEELMKRNGCYRALRHEK